MTPRNLILRSLRFYWRTNLGVLLGAALATGILVGALAVGDSVRYTLERLALARLGSIQLALVSSDRFFREELAADIERDLGVTVTPVLMLRGTAATPDGEKRVNETQVVGVDERFWRLGGSADLLHNAGADEIVVNTRLADRLGLKIGDVIIVRLEQPSYISLDAPLSGEADASVALRVRVRAIAGDEKFGRFSLQANQVPPWTAFVPLDFLQKELKRSGRANALLVGNAGNVIPVERATTAVRKWWALADAELEVVEYSDPRMLELRTSRVFLGPHVEDALQKGRSSGLGVLTYFVNEVRHGEHTTPYSMVTAAGWLEPGSSSAYFYPWLTPVPADMKDDEILINSWLADDLHATIADTVEITYFVLGSLRTLEERSARFRVLAVLPLEGSAVDPGLMPKYPGIYDSQDCRDWQPGIPFDTQKIRDKDEKYWELYRGTPKAFITLATGQKLWGNRFGKLTAVRYAFDSEGRTPIKYKVREQLDPTAFGLFFQPVREQALTASRQALDFGQLFVGFSFFLIVAALLLMAMLFVLNLEQRNEEAGLLLAVGFQPAQVRRLFLAEGFAIALLGTLIGMAAGTLYAKLALYGLSTVWHQAVGATQFVFHAEASTIVAGAAAGLCAALLAMWVAARKQARRPASQLLSSGAEFESAVTSRRSSGLWLGGLCFAGALALVVTSGGGKDPRAAPVFFGAGSLLLVAGLAFTHGLLVSLATTSKRARTLNVVGLRNSVRRRGRSLTMVGVLASGIFLIVAVSAFRHDPSQGARERRSGTGGFALFGQSTLPIYEDLNGQTGREKFGLMSGTLKGVTVLPMRVRDGDDASCLNLNRALQPRLLGVRAEELAKRDAFTFVRQTPRKGPINPWLQLDQQQSDGAVPAIGDEQTVTWALGKKLGDTLPYTDDRGNTFQIRIVGIVATSILQGALVISEQDFVDRFPSAAGYRTFLIDAPWEQSDEVEKILTLSLRDRGLEITPSWQRLAEFLAVENTYIAIFQALGGLGLLLGSIGLGIVVLRNVLERRSELALLRAVGFSRRLLRRMVVNEHWLLLFLGVACGVCAAVIAVWPALRSPGANLPGASLAFTVVVIAASGAAWIWLAAAAALRGPLLTALRNE